MKKPKIAIFLMMSVLLSCQSTNKQIDRAKYDTFISKGNMIAGTAQGVLLSNVSRAMSSGGPVYAVEFCNLKASTLIDSLNKVNHCEIMRVTDRNRNPENRAGTEMEKELISAYVAGMERDTLIRAGEKLIYFKPIRTGMPACLLCHGIPGEDISAETLGKIREMYPEDLATGYVLNDFRGMWKIEFSGDF